MEHQISSFAQAQWMEYTEKEKKKKKKKIRLEVA